MAGLDGIQKKIDPRKEGYGPYDFNLYTLSPEEQKKLKQLPRTLDESLNALEADNEFLTKNGVFPSSLIDLWIGRKRKDAARYNQLPHPVEYEMYYDL
jgi:glutamine synthetase